MTDPADVVAGTWGGEFWSRVDQTAGPDACWPWTLSCNTGGYGQFGKNRRTVRAHRYAFELVTGQDLTPDQKVCHACDNPPCCNPAHLFLGTQADNIRDMCNKGRVTDGSHAEKGEARYNAKLTEASVREIRRSSATHVVLAAKFGVDPSLVSQVRRGVAWKHVA